MTYQGLIYYRDSIQLYYIVLFIKVDYYVHLDGGRMVADTVVKFSGEKSSLKTLVV